jgi:hypothetical protein
MSHDGAFAAESIEAGAVIAVSPKTSAARRVTSVALTSAVSLAGADELFGSAAVAADVTGLAGVGACWTTRAVSRGDVAVLTGDGLDGVDVCRPECRQPADSAAVAMNGRMNFVATFYAPDIEFPLTQTTASRGNCPARGLSR